MTREEAIKELRGFIGQLTEGCQEAIKVLVPELAESEDERIRQEIISALKFANNGGVYDKHIAYLEKQKEQRPVEIHIDNPNIQKLDPNVVIETRTVGTGDLDGKALLDYPIEQRPAEWKPTEEQFNYLAKAIMTLGEEGDCKTAGVLSEIRNGLKCSFPDWKMSSDYPKEGCNVSLNGEVKKIQEWSEEDERVIRDACNWIAEYAGFLISENKDKAEMLWKLSEKLKSLRPSWKPSEEQMEALKKVAYYSPGTDENLIRLYQDLKKL